MIFLFSILGALATFLSREKLSFNSIRASVVPTIIFSFFINYFSLDLIYLNAFYGATFVGMTSSHHFKFYHIIIAASIFSLLFIQLIPYLGGMGGSLGVSAFISVIIVVALCALVKKALNLKKSGEKNEIG